MNWSIFYAALTFATVGIAYAAEHGRRPYPGPFMAACVLLATWLVSNLSVWFMPRHHDLFYPVMDISAGVLFFAVWWRHREAWLFALGALFAVEVCMHFIYRTQPHADPVSARYMYDLGLNIVYTMQIFCVILKSFAMVLNRGK